jgi:D-threo-aldose 1-dehydrogenase
MESVLSVLQALESGIPAIDTSPSYGDAEAFVGRALREWRGTRPLVSTKVGRLKSYVVDNGFYDYSEAGMQKSVENSLETLGMSTLDLLFLHEPAAIPPEAAERVVGQLLEFKRKGYARQLGVGGNPPEWFKPFLRKEYFDVVMETGRLTAIRIDALNDSIPFYKSKEILTYLASPLYMGLLGKGFDTFRAEPPAWLDNESLQRAIRLRQLPAGRSFPLSTLSHRFILSFREEFRLVIGPSNASELAATLADIAAGPLPRALFEEIYHMNS